MGGIKLGESLQAELKEGLLSLLAARRLAQPDGRPLYAYRFTRAEINEIEAMLRRCGPSSLQDRNGAALVVAHVAEWFRRERSGGHWDWIRPLKTLGLDYGPRSTIQYRDVEGMVGLGLRVWRRPEPSGNERLLAIVREAGFPVASVREDPRISSWLKNSVLCAEKGFSTHDAVSAEAWRVSDRLAEALFGAAINLCDKIVELRGSLSPADSGHDPVNYLDQSRPNWRNELPFDVENDDIRSMIEQIVRFRADGDAALDVRRHLVRVGEGWQARASLNLAGRVDLRRFPSCVAGAIQDGRRVRIFPRPPYCDEVVAVAAIETFEQNGETTHELRAFVSKFDVPLSLESEARLLVQSGSASVDEFVPTGGEALSEPVIAMVIEQLDDLGLPYILRVLGSSPTQTSRPLMVLAITEAHRKSVTFSDGFTELGQCSASRRSLVSFWGSATFLSEDTQWSWRTSADRPIDGRPVLVGNLLRNVREPIFKGVPQVWIDRSGHLVAPKRGELRWRPKGRGTWRSVEGSEPWGQVELAIFEQGYFRFSIGASIVPGSFDMTVDRAGRELRISCLNTRMLVAHGSRKLDCRFENGAAVVALGHPTGTANITLTLRWDAELVLTLPDPSCDLRLVDAENHLLPPRSNLSVDGLKGIRIVSTREIALFLELRATDTPKLTISRNICGEVPLSAFADTIAQLLGSSKSLDARVAVSTIGASEHIAEVRWYAEDADPFDAPKQNVFSILATTHGLDVQAFSLAQPAAGVVSVVAPARQSAMRAELIQLLPTGPWLIFGRRRNGAKIRPRVIPKSRLVTNEGTSLERAINMDSAVGRGIAFRQAYARPAEILERDRRLIVDLLALVRREKLPISSVDALKELGHSPGFATLLLANCDSPEERASLLDLQRDLPFLWAATTVADWLTAFSIRLNDARKRLAAVGIDEAIAYRSELAALSEIVGLRPEMAGHAKAVFLRLLAADMARLNRSVDGTQVQFLKVKSVELARRDTDRMIGRHDDADWPPQKLLSLQNRIAQEKHWAPYDSAFIDVIAAPFAIADHASGNVMLSEEELRRCRDAWLYDPEFFEAVVPLGVDQSLRGSRKLG